MLALSGLLPPSPRYDLDLKPVHGAPPSIRTVPLHKMSHPASHANLIYSQGCTARWLSSVTSYNPYPWAAEWPCRFIRRGPVFLGRVLFLSLCGLVPADLCACNRAACPVSALTHSPPGGEGQPPPEYGAVNVRQEAEYIVLILIAAAMLGFKRSSVGSGAASLSHRAF